MFLYENGLKIADGIIAKTIYKAHDSKTALLGAFNGAAYEFQGFIYNFLYASQLIIPESTPDYDHFINCDWDEYLDAEGECE